MHVSKQQEKYSTTTTTFHLKFWKIVNLTSKMQGQVVKKDILQGILWFHRQSQVCMSAGPSHLCSSGISKQTFHMTDTEQKTR